MCYKDELQNKNAENLRKRFEKDNAPYFLQRIFSNIGGGSKATAITYWIAVRDLLQYAIDKKIINKDSIAEIEPEDMLEIEGPEVNEYLEYKENSGMSPTTLYTRKNIYKSFWEEMIATRKIPVEFNVIKKVSYQGIPYDPNNVLAKLPLNEDIEFMIEKIKWKKDDFIRERNIVIMSLLMGTGIREAGLAGLDVADIFLEAEVPYFKVMMKGDLHKSTARSVFLSENDTVEAMRHWMKIRSTINNVIDKEAVFLNKNGKRMNEENIKSMFKTYSNRKITPHKIRHWYATTFAKKYGVQFVQQQLGHRSEKTTVNNYMDARLSVLRGY